VDIREVVVVAPLLALSLFLGVHPQPVLDRIEPASDRAVRNFERKTDYRSPEHSDERRERMRDVEREAEKEAEEAKASHGDEHTSAADAGRRIDQGANR
jgi:NADH-quinone oxidoreductase subunit M